MARLLSIFIISFVLLPVFGGDEFFLREHSLSKPYDGNTWDFVGSTIVTNRFVRLTADTQSMKGALWNRIPVHFTDWEVHFEFKVHGKGKDLFGDGFAMFYAKERNELGPVFGNKDFFSGLAIILDTYSNHNGPHNHGHPYISAMVNDGTLHYDHDKDGTHTEIAGCESQFRNKDFTTQLIVRYQNFKLTVLVNAENKNEWKECFSVDKVELPTNYYFGFAAATGDLSDNHDIISVKVLQLESPRTQMFGVDHSQIIPKAATAPADREHVSDDASESSGVWKFFKYLFYIIFFLALAIGLGVGGYLYYSKQQRERKRFY